jgi:cadmium resistance protein CadD (predicted permease)
LFASVGAAFAAFCATSIDELLILVAAFAKAAQPAPSLTAADIVLGTLLGTSCVLALSALGLVGALLPTRYVKLLGLVPLLLGLRQLARRFAKWRARRRGPPGAPAAPLLAESPPAGASPAVEEPPPPPPAPPPFWGAAALGVAAVVLAGGAEEIAVYLPLLAAEGGSAANVAAVVGTIACMTAAWLGAAAACVRCGAVARAVEAAGEAAEPWCFVGIGVYCLVGSVLIPVQF